MIDVAADTGYLETSLTMLNMVQCNQQARWHDESSLLTLPRVTQRMRNHIRHKGKPVKALADLAKLPDNQIKQIFSNIRYLDDKNVEEVSYTV